MAFRRLEDTPRKVIWAQLILPQTRVPVVPDKEKAPSARIVWNCEKRKVIITIIIIKKKKEPEQSNTSDMNAKE